MNSLDKSFSCIMVITSGPLTNFCMTTVSAGHIILTPTKPVGGGWPQGGSNPGPPNESYRYSCTWTTILFTRKTKISITSE